MIAAVEAAEAIVEMAVAMEAVAIMEEMVVTEVMESVIEPEAVEIKRPVVGRIAIIEVAPRSNADEHSVHEICRSPVSIGCARIRIVGIKSPLTDWRRIVKTVTWPDLYADGNLCL